MLSLILGNLHVPYRSVDLPDKFKQLLKSNQNKIEKIFICSTAEDPIMQSTVSTSLLLEFLHKEVCSDIELVNSSNADPKVTGNDFKHQLQAAPTLNHKVALSKPNCISVYNINSFKVAFLSQYTIVPKDDVLALLNLSRQATSDILIWAGKHEVEAYSLEGVLFLSPGTATGAFSVDELKQETEEQEINENSGDLKASAIVEEEEPHASESATSDIESKSKDEPLDGNHSSADGKTPTLDENIVEKVEKLSLKETVPEPELEESIENIPAFILLDIPKTEVQGEDNTCTVYIYSLLGENQELKIDKVTFVKN